MHPHGLRVLRNRLQQMGLLGENIRLLSDGQSQLAGGLEQVNKAQSLTQTQMINTMEKRLEEVQRSMGETLHGTATRTARS